jgi:hypothetical protein
MDYFSLVFSDELLNNIVIDTNKYARDKIVELNEARCPLGIGDLISLFLN